MTTQIIENPLRSSERGEVSTSGGKRDTTEPAIFDRDAIKRRYTGQPTVFDPEAIKRRYKASVEKDNTRVSDAKRDDAQAESSRQQSNKQQDGTSDGRMYTRLHVPSLGYRDVYDWLLKSVWLVLTFLNNIASRCWPRSFWHPRLLLSYKRLPMTLMLIDIDDLQLSTLSCQSTISSIFGFICRCRGSLKILYATLLCGLLLKQRKLFVGPLKLTLQ